MTAIAAVLALSSTPSLAQDAATVTDAPPVPVVAPEPVPEPAPAPEPVATETVTPAAEQSVETAQQSAPAAVRTARAASAVRRADAPAPSPAVRASAPAAAVEGAAATPAPIAAPADSLVPPPIPVQQAAAPQAEASAGDDMLPIAGAAGAGVLALAGAFALSRRRRRHDEVGYEPETVDADHVATVEPEPIAATPVAARAMPERSAVPVGLDLSRFGRHTQAAYRGPTPDNPSLSLKRRLKRAAFFDGRERMAGEAIAPVTEPAPMNAAAADTVTTKVEQLAGQPAATASAPRRSVRPASKPLFGFHQPAFQN